MLTIYKASAGSGKTFQLVFEYLKLILINELNYRRILAVTFTNRATAEMKTRILEQLHQLASGEESKYLEPLKTNLQLTENVLRLRAKIILRNILFSFNYFSVSTIDKFTQRIIKAFNREIGIASNYEVELDNELLLQEAVDRLIENAGSNPEIIGWLVNLSRNKIQDNLNYNIEKDLHTIGNELFKENFQYLSDSLQVNFPEKTELKEFLKKLNEIISRFEATLIRMARSALEMIEKTELVPEDFNNKKSGPVGCFLKIADKKFDPPRLTDRNSTESPEKWYTKKSKDRDKIHTLAENHLIPVMTSIIEFYDRNNESYNTACTARKNLFTFGILIDLKCELDQIRHEKDILPISHSNLYLHKIIEGSDSPFIFEKAGNRFNHFLLDEFQDTSVMQWNNFLPLIRNSLAYGYQNMVTGDVKQSIYRWRNSDWKILAASIHSDIPKEQSETFTLQQNWRSRQKIVEFNNAAFPIFNALSIRKLKEEFGEPAPPRIEAWYELVRQTYSDVVQSLPEKMDNQGGYVEINIVDAEKTEDFGEKSLNLLLNQVIKLFDKGYQPSDLAILVRRKQDGISIVNFFLQASGDEKYRDYNLSVFSNESLFLTNSPTVQFIILLFRFFINQDEKLIQAALVHIFKDFILPELRKNNKLPETRLEIAGISMQGTGEIGLSPDFSIDFESFFIYLKKNLLPGIQSNSTDEAIIRICSEFRLFEIQQELPYLQALIDKTTELKKSTTGDLSNFIKWWEENGSTLSITLNESVNAIRLLTIHTAKGLEFDAVLIPFFSWSVNHLPSNPPILWCSSPVQPYDDLGIIPINYSKSLKDTYFKEEFSDEHIRNAVDNLNLAYVALTRSKSALFINCPKETKTETIGRKLVDALPELIKILPVEVENHPENERFFLGELVPQLKKNKSDQAGYLDPGKYFFDDFTLKLNLFPISENFLDENEGGKTAKNLGKIIHEILSDIGQISDIEPAVKKAFFGKIIIKEEYQTIIDWLTHLLNSSDVIDWFSGKYRIINERNIISPKGILRPDRLMVDARRAIVVDYKISDYRLPEHKLQVSDYSVELKKCGFDSVSGYLWYIRKNEIEKVCDL